MDIILGLVMMVFGIVGLVRRELKVSSDMVARGGRALAASIVLVVSLPLAFLAGFVRAIAERAAHGPIFGAVFPGLLTYIVLFVCAVAAVVIVRLGKDT